MNVKAQLEFELAYYDSAVNHFNHYITKTPPHLRDDIDKLYVSRKEGRRRLTSIKDGVHASMRGLEDFIKKSKKKLITEAKFQHWLHKFR